MDRNLKGRTGAVSRVDRKLGESSNRYAGEGQPPLINSLSFTNDLRRLERTLGERLDDLHQIAESIREHYREKLEWRKGKERRLLIPSWRLKLIQIRLHRHVFRRLAPHPAAYAVRGRGAVRAAERHRGNRWFYHRDIKDFYPSVSTAFVRQRFLNLGVHDATADLLSKLVTVEDQLPQGAPTSPAVGEIALRRLDIRISRLVDGHGLVYTRYLDDITVSGGQHLRDRFVDRIDEIIADCGWTLNSKGGLAGPDQSHKMLGLTVNQHLGVPRAMYDQVRQIIKLAQKGSVSLTSTERQSLRGKINWISTVNPRMGEKLLAAFEELPASAEE